MKNILLSAVFVFLFVSSSWATDRDHCKDFIQIHIDMEDDGGYVEIYYVDCDGKSRQDVFRHESGVVCADTRYEISLSAIEYDGYDFIGWGNDDINGTYVEMPLCEDLYLAPRFQDYDDHHDHDDHDDHDEDESCFIQNLK